MTIFRAVIGGTWRQHRQWFSVRANGSISCAATIAHRRQRVWHEWVTLTDALFAEFKVPILLTTDTLWGCVYLYLERRSESSLVKLEQRLQKSMIKNDEENKKLLALLREHPEEFKTEPLFKIDQDVAKIEPRVQRSRLCEPCTQTKSDENEKYRAEFRKDLEELKTEIHALFRAALDPVSEGAHARSNRHDPEQTSG
ncbi:MAG: hypothetical protein MHM6MM_005300 [Cercozoa sp. M6MM]